MSQTDIEQIEMSIEEARKMVDMAEAARRLADHPDFKRVILDGYFVNEASRLALLIDDPGIPANQQKLFENALRGPSALKRYLMSLTAQGDHAKVAIESSESELELIRMELEDEE